MREAGALARGYFGQRVKSWEKAKGAPVTEADLAVDRLLHERLRGGFGRRRDSEWRAHPRVRPRRTRRLPHDRA